ncbi:MAG: hypothetical protein AAF738_05745 [Bacteroidota bacterium]
MKTYVHSLLLLLSTTTSLFAQQAVNAPTAWTLTKDDALEWKWDSTRSSTYVGEATFSGRKIAVLLRYMIDEQQQLSIQRELIFPQLRAYLPVTTNKTAAYFRPILKDDFLPNIVVGQTIISANPPIDKITQTNSAITFHHRPISGLKISRQCYPSMEDSYMVEMWTVQNVSKQTQNIQFGNTALERVQAGYEGRYQLHAFSEAEEQVPLAAGDKYQFPIYYGVSLNSERSYRFKHRTAKEERSNFVMQVEQQLQVETPSSAINTYFRRAKIQVTECLFDSDMGLVHSSGNGQYYASIQAEDQALNSGPLFPYLAYQAGETAAYNIYKQFQQHIPSDIDTPIPYAFEIGGHITRQGLDRGDAAMLAYGTAHFLLASGEKELAKELWSLVAWTLNYCEQHRNRAGAVLTNADEQGNQFPAAIGNLAATTRYYGGLKYGLRLAKALKLDEESILYKRRLEEIKNVIETYFGATVKDWKTYQYFKGHPDLHSSIYLPLEVGIKNRRAATLDALLDTLWVMPPFQQDSTTVIDLFSAARQLQTIKAAFRAGAVDEALDKWLSYTNQQLFAPTAHPLSSATSALYCRTVTEGLLGIEPLTFNSVLLHPTLPTAWNYFKVKNITLAGVPVDIDVERKGKSLEVSVKQQGLIILRRRISNNEKVELVLMH